MLRARLEHCRPVADSNCRRDFLAARRVIAYSGDIYGSKRQPGPIAVVIGTSLQRPSCQPRSRRRAAGSTGFLRARHSCSRRAGAMNHERTPPKGYRVKIWKPGAELNQNPPKLGGERALGRRPDATPIKSTGQGSCGAHRMLTDKSNFTRSSNEVL